MLFIVTVYKRLCCFPDQSKIGGEMSRMEFIHMPGKWYFLCILVEGTILTTFVTCVEMADIEKQRDTLCDSEGCEEQ